MKNLTACLGCTRKHAKCTWKDVQADELEPTASSATPQPEATPVAVAEESAAPLSAGSTIEVNRQADEMLQSASIARASLDLAGEKTDTAMDSPEEYPEPPAKTEPAPATTSSGKFDVRPPPLVQQLQDAADGRSPAGPRPYVPTFSAREKVPDDDDDEGDRLQALASRVYRSASQGGHRAQ